MCTLKSTFSRIARTIITWSIIHSLPAAALTDEEAGANQDQGTYKKMLSEASLDNDKNMAFELIASGSAATLVGVYGYYFDNRGELAKLAYAATQTAGIFVAGDGIYHYYSQNTLVDLDEQLTSDSVTSSKIRRSLAKNHVRNIRAKQRADAWTAGLLGGLYAYNGLRANGSASAVRSVYFFLSANALAVSAFNTYKLISYEGSAHEISLRIGIGTLTANF